MQKQVDLQQRSAKLGSLYDEFNDLQTDIAQECDDEHLENEYAERINFTNDHATYTASALCLVSKLNEMSSSETNNTTHSELFENKVEFVKLPPVTIPSFNGEFCKWIEFKETFELLVHQNSSLNDIQKFHYLRTSLGTKVQQIVKHLEFSKQNYILAWQALCKRFDNPHLLVNSHIKALFNLKSVTQETASAVRELVDTVNQHLLILKNLNLSYENPLSSAILIHIISDKLDKVTLKEWEQKYDKDTLPEVNDLFKFLDNKANQLEKLEERGIKANSQVQQRSQQRKPFKKHVSLVSNNFSNAKQICHLCKSDHLIYYCPQFLQLGVSQRWTRIIGMKLCKNCLCKGHFSKDCRHVSCKVCKGKHNTLLHHYQDQGTDSINYITSSNMRPAQAQLL
ncbi:uncharacterized protein [Diabrotica undecimpunctata]|uniref:uncharacterized protein n=1 Tax=Diabrotica undecimpunctata TaxID=50387 RepID=UPI003B63C2D2